MLVVALPWSTVLPMLAKLVELMREPSSATTLPVNDERMITMLQVAKAGTVATFLGSMGSMLMAAVCTVALIVMSRRATLRQVNMRLGEISDQLKLLAAKKT
jgi:hypothetical protein